jgi:hypothetical protein
VRIARRAWRLSAREVRWLAAALALLPLASLGSRVLGVRRCVRLFQSILGRPGSNASRPSTAAAITVARMVRIAAVYGPCRANCMTRSIVTWALLRRTRVAAEIKIGVRKSGLGLDAHAWVELDGQAIESPANSSGAAFIPLCGASQFLEAVE